MLEPPTQLLILAGDMSKRHEFVASHFQIRRATKPAHAADGFAADAPR